MWFQSGHTTHKNTGRLASAEKYHKHRFILAVFNEVNMTRWLAMTPLRGSSNRKSYLVSKNICPNAPRSQFQTAQYVLENDKEGFGSGSTDSLEESVKYPNCESRFRINGNVMNSLTVPSPSKNEDVLNETAEIQ